MFFSFFFSFFTFVTLAKSETMYFQFYSGTGCQNPGYNSHCAVSQAAIPVPSDCQTVSQNGHYYYIQTISCNDGNGKLQFIDFCNSYTNVITIAPNTCYDSKATCSTISLKASCSGMPTDVGFGSNESSVRMMVEN